MSFHISDYEMIEEAGLNASLKFVAQTTVASLHFLRELSQLLGKPMEQLTAKDVVDHLKEAKG